MFQFQDNSSSLCPVTYFSPFHPLTLRETTLESMRTVMDVSALFVNSNRITIARIMKMQCKSIWPCQCNVQFPPTCCTLSYFHSLNHSPRKQISSKSITCCRVDVDSSDILIILWSCISSVENNLDTKIVLQYLSHNTKSCNTSHSIHSTSYSTHNLDTH